MSKEPTTNSQGLSEECHAMISRISHEVRNPVAVIMLRLLMLFNNKKNVMKKLLLRKLLKRLLVKLNLQRIILLKVLLVLLINVCVLLKENSMLWLALNSHLEL